MMSAGIRDSVEVLEECGAACLAASMRGPGSWTHVSTVLKLIAHGVPATTGERQTGLR
jgi:hypothetical protein